MKATQQATIYTSEQQNRIALDIAKIRWSVKKQSFRSEQKQTKQQVKA